MAIPIVHKTPAAVIAYVYDFTNDLPSGTSIGTIATALVDSSEAASTALTITGTGTNVVTLTISGGVNFEDYLVTLTGSTATGGFVLPHQFEVRVRTTPIT